MDNADAVFNDSVATVWDRTKAVYTVGVRGYEKAADWILKRFGLDEEDRKELHEEFDFLVGHQKFRQAAEALAEGTKTDSPFAVLQGEDLLTSHGP